MYKILWITLPNHNQFEDEFIQEEFIVEKKNIEEIEICEISYSLCLVDVSDKKYLKKIENIININKDVPFWAISDDSSKQKVISAYNLGFENYLKYPIDENLFLNLKIKFMSEYDVEDEKKFEIIMHPKILIVDDNEFNLEVFKEIVSVFNADLIMYLNSNEAVDSINNEAYDLILLDIMMPDLNGFDLAKIVKKSKYNKNVPLIFMSALKELRTKLYGYKLGSYAYIEKPFNIRVVRAIIANALRIKFLQDSLYKEKLKFDNIMNFSNREISLLDKELNVLSSNNMLYYSCLAKNFLTVITEYNDENEIQDINNFVKNKNLKNKTYKLKFRRNKNEDYTYISASISKVYSENNELIGFISIMEDITEELRVELQKDIFMATLTHDLKTPIRSQIQVLELLLNNKFGKMTPEQQKMINEVKNSCKFMQHMTNNLLVKFDIDKGVLKLNKEKCNLKKLLEDIVKDLKYLLEEKNQELILITDGCENEVELDEISIKRVLNNLIINASEYSPKMSKITLYSQIMPKCFTISIVDNGCGLSQDDIKEIFSEWKYSAKRFKKVGSGFGLYICKQIIDKHGGEISVRSEINKGSEFFISIPQKNLAFKSEDKNLSTIS